MDGDKNVQAVFNKSLCWVSASIIPAGTAGNNCYYAKGKIKITEVKTGKVISEINQKEWVHSMITANPEAIAYIGSEYLVEIEAYFSQDGKNAITSGTLDHRGQPMILGAGGVIKISDHISPEGPGKTANLSLQPYRIIQ